MTQRDVMGSAGRDGTHHMLLCALFALIRGCAMYQQCVLGLCCAAQQLLMGLVQAN
jgi:hypothetical protein